MGPAENILVPARKYAYDTHEKRMIRVWVQLFMRTKFAALTASSAGSLEHCIAHIMSAKEPEGRYIMVHSFCKEFTSWGSSSITACTGPATARTHVAPVLLWKRHELRSVKK